MNFKPEMLDLVDENDQVIDVVEREHVYRLKLSNFRAVNAFIKNSEGKLFIPRRHPDKRIFPLALDMSVGGHVSSGETYDEAFAREAKEELNIDILQMNYKTLGMATPTNDGTSCFQKLYEIESDETPNYNKDDFVEHYWLTPEELLERILGGDPSKEDLPKILKKFYLRRI